MGETFDTNIDFFLMNHWMNEAHSDLPYEGNAEEFNSLSALSERYSLCTERKPNIVAVDFWSIGNVLDFVKQVNQELAGGGEGSTTTTAVSGGTSTADTGGTIMTDMMDVIENKRPTEGPTVMAVTNIPTYAPTES